MIHVLFYFSEPERLFSRPSFSWHNPKVKFCVLRFNTEKMIANDDLTNLHSNYDNTKNIKKSTLDTE